MNGLIERFAMKNWVGDSAYAIFRILVAFNFLQHGIQNIFGLWGGTPGIGGIAPAYSLLWFAGIIELAVGTFVILGIFVRLFAFISVIEMLYAYSFVHAPHGYFPIQNQGELAILYLSSFLVMAAAGAGKFSLEKYVLGKEIF